MRRSSLHCATLARTRHHAISDARQSRFPDRRPLCRGAPAPELLPDPTLIDLYGTRDAAHARRHALHGRRRDTRNSARKVRNPEYQRQFLAQPLLSRKQIIAGLRTENTEKKQSKSESHHGRDTGDRRRGAARARLSAPDSRPHASAGAASPSSSTGTPCERWVLADWYTKGSYLRCDRQAAQSSNLPPPELPSAIRRSAERLPEIADQVVKVLDAYRQPD